MKYQEFIEHKIDVAPETGIMDFDPVEINPILKPHQRDMVTFAVRGGRRGIFARFGLGKAIMQLEYCRIVQAHEGGRMLIVMPLNVMRSSGTTPPCWAWRNRPTAGRWRR